MPAAPDQFQKRTFVRLPYSDQYLKERSGRGFREQLSKAFQRPLYTAQITENDSSGSQSRAPIDERRGVRSPQP